MARSNSRWPPWAAGSTASSARSCPPGGCRPTGRRGAGPVAVDGTEDVQPPGERPQTVMSWPQHPGVGPSRRAASGDSAVEPRPRRRRLVGQPPAPGGAAVLPAEARRAGSVQGGESPTEVLLGHTTGSATLDPRQHEQRPAPRQTPPAPKARQPLPPHRSTPAPPLPSRRIPTARARSLLDEHPATVDQLHAVGDGHIATEPAAPRALLRYQVPAQQRSPAPDPPLEYCPGNSAPVRRPAPSEYRSRPTRQAHTWITPAGWHYRTSNIVVRSSARFGSWTPIDLLFVVKRRSGRFRGAAERSRSAWPTGGSRHPTGVGVKRRCRGGGPRRCVRRRGCGVGGSRGGCRRGGWRGRVGRGGGCRRWRVGGRRRRGRRGWR